ncbi:MAG: hypothetical protein MZV70_74115 [Desulfobacterales bacterium]|nr:hypothetical protein [Desulfobacterales bacterium]
MAYPPAGILIITDYLSNIRRLQEIVKALDVEGAGEQITYLPLLNASASEVAKSLTNVFQQRRPNLTPIRMVRRSQNQFHDYLCQRRRYGKRAQAGGDDG